MKKIINAILNILYAAIPHLHSCIANIKIKKKICGNESEDENENLKSLYNSMFSPSETLDNLGLGNLKELYRHEIERKTNFENKAKTNVIAVTIAVTLVLGAYTMIQNIASKYKCFGVNILAVVLFSLAVIYMLCAGIASINVIVEKTIVQKIDYGLKNLNQKKEDYYFSIAVNRAYNLIRNNSISDCYRCIRNSLVILVIIMIVAIWPYREEKTEIRTVTKNDFCYSEQCFSILENTISVEYVEYLINAYLDKEIDVAEPVYIVDNNEKIIICFSKREDIVNVFLISRYEEYAEEIMK